jgi:hypothetical protein
MEGCQRSIGIDSDVEVLMHQIIVAFPLADDPEVIHERFFGANPAAKVTTSYTCPMIFGSGRESNTTETAWNFW